MPATRAPLGAGPCVRVRAGSSAGDVFAAFGEQRFDQAGREQGGQQRDDHDRAFVVVGDRVPAAACFLVQLLDREADRERAEGGDDREPVEGEGGASPGARSSRARCPP